VRNARPDRCPGLTTTRCGQSCHHAWVSQAWEENHFLVYKFNRGSPFNNSNSYSISNLTTNVTYWVSSYNSQGCESAFAAISNLCRDDPLPSVPTPGTNARCGAGAVTLTATPGANGNSVRWYSARREEVSLRQARVIRHPV